MPALTRKTMPLVSASTGDSVSTGMPEHHLDDEQQRDRDHARRPHVGDLPLDERHRARAAAQRPEDRGPGAQPGGPQRQVGPGRRSTPRHCSQLVSTHMTSSARLCHIHSRPQFSSTVAWCVSRNSRAITWLNTPDAGGSRLVGQIGLQVVGQRRGRSRSAARAASAGT